MEYHTIRLAGVSLPYRPRFPETVDYFTAFRPSASHVGALIDRPQDAPTDRPRHSERSEESASPVPRRDGTLPSASPVHIPSHDWAEYLALGMEDSAHSEFSQLTPYFSDALLPFDRVIIHGVALRWHDRAWLICAASGVGKSTQAKTLQELRPGEFSVICGDRPVLEFRHSERSEGSSSPNCHSERSEESASPVLPPPFVHPSHWNGKENWHGAAGAPLAGLILLERGEENRLVSVQPREVALTAYSYFQQTCWDAENIRRVAALETRLLNSVPLWKLSTHDVPASTKLLLDGVFCD